MKQNKPINELGSCRNQKGATPAYVRLYRRLGDLIEEKRNLTGFIESGMRLFGMGKG
jgi:hypothetical protein